jgi:hypothetical protein
VLLMCAVLAALIVAALVYLPGRMITQRAELGSTLQVEIPDRDMAVYTTLETWRAAECTLVGADGESYELRPDMTSNGWLDSPPGIRRDRSRSTGRSGSRSPVRGRRVSSRSAGPSGLVTSCSGTPPGCWAWWWASSA